VKDLILPNPAGDLIVRVGKNWRKILCGAG